MKYENTMKNNIKVLFVLFVVTIVMVSVHSILVQYELNNKIKSISYQNSYTTEKLNNANATINRMRKTIDNINVEYAVLETDYSTLETNYDKLEDSHEKLATVMYGPKNELNTLDKYNGVNYHNGHKETFYNLNMSKVVEIAKTKNIKGEYWVRKDGAKMFGKYVIVAADQSKYEYGSIVSTSLGDGIVLDTGTFRFSNSEQFDIATAW